MIKLFAICLGLFFSTNSISQIKFIGKLGNEKIYIDKANNGFKIGNAYSTRVYKEEDDYLSSSRILMDCKGQWISDEYDFDYYGSSERMAAVKKSKGNDSKEFTEASYLYKFEDSDIRYKALLKRQLNELCNTKQSSKPFAFPIAASAEDKDKRFSIYNLIAPRNKKEDGVNIVWIKEEPKILKEWLKSDGTAYLRRDGNPMMITESYDKSYALLKYAADCKNSKIDVLTKIEYNNDGVNKTIYDSPLIKKNMNDITPTTIGEIIVDSVCKIYGN